MYPQHTFARLIITSYGAVDSEMIVDKKTAPRSKVDIRITDRQNVDKWLKMSISSDPPDSPPQG
jgi:hypothetical protein